MDLLLVVGSFPLRSETFIYRKVVALARRGHQVTVATRRIGDWSLFPDGLPPNARVIELLPDHSLRDPRRVLSAVRGLSHLGTSLSRVRGLYETCQRDERTKRAARKHFLRHAPFLGFRPDLVHFEFLSLGAMYPLAGEITGAPVVVSCRGADLHTLELRDSVERQAAIDCLLSARGIHCVSAEMAEEVARISGRRSQVWVNRPAVDVNAIRPRSGERLPGRLRLLATGRLVWKKGFDYLLASLALLAERGVDFEAEILGDGELKSELRFSIGDLGLADRVRLAGGVPPAEVLARLSQTDIFMLSSVEEGISNAVLEAMASGVPVVTTNAGGMAEAVTDGVEGFVVPVRDVARFADRLEVLARDPALRASMGRAARERAEREFSITRQVDEFEKIYMSCCEVRA